MKRKTALQLSKSISTILNPLIMPSLGTAMLLFGHSVMSAVPAQSKWFLMGMVALNTALIPAILITLLIHLRFLPGHQYLTENRKSRLLPIAIVALTYVICTLLLKDVLMAFLIRRFLLTALCCAIFAMGVTLFWNISAGMTAIGGLMAIMIVMTFSRFAQFPILIMLFLLLAGLLGASQLYLGRHTLSQVAAGFFGGFLTGVAGMLFI